MKFKMKYKLVYFLFLTTILAYSQNATVEKNLFGVQIGFPNLISFQFETRLARTITLHNEAGLSYFASTSNSKTSGIEDKNISGIAPFINIEPRWYYSLDRRFKKGKKILNNSANFISLNTVYLSSKTPINQNYEEATVYSAILVMPTFGIRRAFAKQFFYEFSYGIGFQYNFFKDNDCNCEHSRFADSIKLGLGYNF
jgi:hypothetical protein